VSVFFTKEQFVFQASKTAHVWVSSRVLFIQEMFRGKKKLVVQEISALRTHVSFDLLDFVPFPQA